MSGGLGQPERGILIVFEGGEGSGKTTQNRKLAVRLADAGYPVLSTHQPGATTIGYWLRQKLLDPATAITARTEALLYAADKAEHAATVIAPALAEGKIVICDRYIISSVAYQGYGRELGPDVIYDLNEWAVAGILPALTVVLDIDTHAGLKRAGRRDSGHTDRVTGEGLSFHQKVRAGYLAEAEKNPDRYMIVRADRDPDVISHEIYDRVIVERLRHRYALNTG